MSNQEVVVYGSHCFTAICMSVRSATVHLWRRIRDKRVTQTWPHGGNRWGRSQFPKDGQWKVKGCILQNVRSRLDERPNVFKIMRISPDALIQPFSFVLFDLCLKLCDPPCEFPLYAYNLYIDTSIHQYICFLPKRLVIMGPSLMHLFFNQFYIYAAINPLWYDYKQLFWQDLPSTVVYVQLETKH